MLKANWIYVLSLSLERKATKEMSIEVQRDWHKLQSCSLLSGPLSSEPLRGRSRPRHWSIFWRQNSDSRLISHANTSTCRLISHLSTIHDSLFACRQRLGPNSERHLFSRLGSAWASQAGERPTKLSMSNVNQSILFCRSLGLETARSWHVPRPQHRPLFLVSVIEIEYQRWANGANFRTFNLHRSRWSA